MSQLKTSVEIKLINGRYTQRCDCGFSNLKARPNINPIKIMPAI
jgi:hypothetical protein